MNNQDFSSFINQDFKELSSWICNMNAFEFTSIATLIGLIIAVPLNYNEQNSLGNFFEQLGQTLETIGAQNQTCAGNNQNTTIQQLRNEMNKMKQELVQIKKQMNNKNM